MSGSTIRVGFAAILFLAATAPLGAAEEYANETAIAPHAATGGGAGTNPVAESSTDSFIDSSAKNCASGYALGAATAMVGGLVGFGLPLTMSAVTGSAAIGCGVAWIGSTAADGFFWMRDQGNSAMNGLVNGE
jgi:hypothetical protein